MTTNQEVIAEPRLSIDLDKVRGEIFIDMDQSTELVQLNYLLRLVNFTVPENSSFNFSQTMAMSLIREYMDRMYTLSSPSTIILICLYIPVFLVSLGGNGLVILVVVCNPHMRRVKNMFLVNLAFADFLVTLICMPMVVGQIVFRLWVYGEFMCKLSGYMQGVAVSASIFTLTALSIDRYLAIKTPLRHVRRDSGHCHAARFLVLIWTLAAAFFGPILYVRAVYEVDFDAFQISMHYCIESWSNADDRRAYAIFLLMITYVLPFVVISICYMLIGRTLCSDDFHRKTSDSSSTVMLGRKRVARMLVVLIAVFMVFWLPYNICSLSLDLSPRYRQTRLLPFTLWFGHAHSAVNPILYWYLNKSFRYCMHKAVKCETLRRGQRDSPSPHPGAIGEILRFDFRRRQEGPGGTVHEPEFACRGLGGRDHGPRPAPNRRCRSASTPNVNVPCRRQVGGERQGGRVVRIVFASNPSSSRLPSTATSRMRASMPAPEPDVLSTAAILEGNDSNGCSGGEGGCDRRQSLPVSVEHVMVAGKQQRPLEDDFL